jgi:hypothetical protein
MLNTTADKQSESQPTDMYIGIGLGVASIVGILGGIAIYYIRNYINTKSDKILEKKQENPLVLRKII